MSDTTPTPTQQAAQDIVLEMCGARTDAASFVFMLWDFAMAWDHVVDGDAIDAPSYDRAMKNVLLALPLNDFFVANRAILVPAMSACIGAWQHSNKAGSPKIKAFDLYTEIPSIVAFILGGQALVDSYIPQLRELAEQNCGEDDAKDGGKK